MVNEFSSIFEIFTALNLAYAGSTVFRDALDNTIFKKGETISTNYKEKIQKIKSEITVIIAEEYEQKLIQKLDNINRYFSRNVENIMNSEQYKSNFPLGIKSIFLVCSLFSFTLLLLGGYEQFYTDKQINDFLFFINWTSITIICIFIRNLLPKKFDQNISPLKSIMFFIFPVLFYILYEAFISDVEKFIKFPENKLNIFISIIISISAFLLHFLRVYIHRTYFRYQLLRVYNETEKELLEFESSINIIKSLNRKGTKLSLSITFLTRIKIFFKALKKDSH